MTPPAAQPAVATPNRPALAKPRLVCRPAHRAPAPRTRTPAKVTRVMHVVLSLAPGGTERLVIEICRRLGHGFAATVCCLDDEGAWATNCGPRVSRSWRCAAGRDSSRRSAGKSRELAARRGDRRPALPSVLAVRLRPHRELLAASAAAVFTEHGRLSDAPPSWKRRLRQSAVCRRFDGSIVAVSRRAAPLHDRARAFRASACQRDPQRHRRRAACRRRRRRARAAALGIGDDAFVVGTVARLDPVKDFGTLLDAFAQVRASGAAIAAGHRRRWTGARAPRRARGARGSGAAPVEFLGHRDDAARCCRPPTCTSTARSAKACRSRFSKRWRPACRWSPPRVGRHAGGRRRRRGRRARAAANPRGWRSAMSRSPRDHARRRRARRAAAPARSSAFTIDRMVSEYARLYHALLRLTRCVASAASSRSTAARSRHPGRHRRR